METDYSIPKDKQWIRVQNGTVNPPKAVTLMTYIRHSIHHPENTHNADFLESELERSIQQMLGVIQSSQFQSLV